MERQTKTARGEGGTERGEGLSFKPSSKPQTQTQGKGPAARDAALGSQDVRFRDDPGVLHRNTFEEHSEPQNEDGCYVTRKEAPLSAEAQAFLRCHGSVDLTGPVEGAGGSSTPCRG